MLHTLLTYYYLLQDLTVRGYDIIPETDVCI